MDCKTEANEREIESVDGENRSRKEIRESELTRFRASKVDAERLRTVEIEICCRR